MKIEVEVNGIIKINRNKRVDKEWILSGKEKSGRKENKEVECRREKR